MISNTTGRKHYIRRDSTCSAPNVAYMTYCKKCKKQSLGSTISWKPRLRKYKSHIKKNVLSCKITNRFIYEYCDEETPFKYLVFCHYRRG